jgi:hypothetical protein
MSGTIKTMREEVESLKTSEKLGMTENRKSYWNENLREKLLFESLRVSEPIKVSCKLPLTVSPFVPSFEMLK